MLLYIYGGLQAADHTAHEKAGKQNMAMNIGQAAVHIESLTGYGVRDPYAAAKVAVFQEAISASLWGLYLSEGAPNGESVEGCMSWLDELFATQPDVYDADAPGGGRSGAEGDWAEVDDAYGVAEVDDDDDDTFAA